MTFSLSHSSGATAAQVANPIKFSRNTIDYRRAPPMLGEHTEEVIANELGWSTERIAALRSRGDLISASHSGFQAMDGYPPRSAARQR